MKDRQQLSQWLFLLVLASCPSLWLLVPCSKFFPHSLSCFGSPGTWESHPETTELVVLQGRVGPAGDEEEEEEEELSSSCEEEGEEDRDADEEGEGEEDTPGSAPGSSLAARNPYALLGEDEC